METLKRSLKIPESILEDCRIKRRKALDEAGERLQEVLKLKPEIADLRNERLMNAYNLSLKLADSLGEDERDRLKEETRTKNSKLLEKEARLLDELGLTSEYLEPHFSCSICSDTGFIGDTVKKPCSCVLQRAMQYRYASSNLENGEYFETHDPSIFRDRNQLNAYMNLFEYAKEYSDSLPYAQVPGILMIGPSGMGKSFILNCIGHRAIERGLSVIKVTAYNLINSALDDMRRSENPTYYSDIDLLLIDDLGTEPSINNITREYLFAVINERHAQMKNTVISTNLSIENLQEVYGERLFSRMIAKRYTRIFTLSGRDLRMSAS